MNSDDGTDDLRPWAADGQAVSGGARADPARTACRRGMPSGVVPKEIAETRRQGAVATIGAGRMAAPARTEPHNTQWYLPAAGAGALGSERSDGTVLPLPKQIADHAAKSAPFAWAGSGANAANRVCNAMA